MLAETLVEKHGGTDMNLRRLVESQRAKTSSTAQKLWQFLQIAVLRRPNTFEQYVVQHESNDCAFVAKYSQVVDVDVSSVTSLSVDSLTLHSLHAPHPLVKFAKEGPLAADVLREMHEAPALVFLHGLGGQVSQFEPLMGLLLQCLEIFALDLPGFGDSRLQFGPHGNDKLSDDDKRRIAASVGAMAWADFATKNIVAIIVEYIRQNIPEDKKVILIGHSMGTHLLIKVAAQLPERKVEGLVLLLPPALDNDVSGEQKPQKGHSMLNLMSVFTYFPFLFNLFRIWDRLEGIGSKSVLRQVPEESSLYCKLRQFRWNLDIDTRVLLRYINGFSRAKYSELISAISRFNDNPLDTRTYEKTVIIGGLEDKVTPVSIISDISSFLSEYWQRKVYHVSEVKSAGHSLLLVKPEFISGIILNHLELKFPERLHLSPAWVLKLKADISGDKWGLKNEIKWLKTQLVSYNITRHDGADIAPLLGMKTLREGDANHSPQVVEDKFYGGGVPTVDGIEIKGKLVAIVDISADIPPYSPKLFAHVKYHKCATVSKVAPDHNAIRRFIQLIDDILSENTEPTPLIAVHCHYGFNRTGFLICCYLIERLGWTVREAVEGFKAAKLPGIKHPHFVDALYVRYE